MDVHHYGLATKNLERSIDVFRSLGYQVSKPVFDPVQQVKVAFVFRKGEHPIELVYDSEAGGPISGIVSKVGSGLYHICYEVDNIEQTIATLRHKGFLLRHKPVKATAFDGRRIAWLYNRDIGLVELLER
ncbi:VOC family protein [bacterium]|nr:VOC family protein [bacterium]